MVPTAAPKHAAHSSHNVLLLGTELNCLLPLPAIYYRWTAAGAWYPFVRNHMGYFARDHEPYQWPAVAAAARKAYGMRYQLLTHLYGELFLAHSQGGALARPLLFADPSDLYAR